MMDLSEFLQTSVFGAHDPLRDSGMNSCRFTSATAACDINVAVAIARIAVARMVSISVDAIEAPPCAAGIRIPSQQRTLAGPQELAAVGKRRRIERRLTGGRPARKSPAMKIS